MTKMYVSVKTQAEFIHCWPAAPTEVAFLRAPHRHMLHIQLTTEVTEQDREIEFILLKRELDEALVWILSEAPDEISCEGVGVLIINWFHCSHGTRVATVEVFEDGENGAIVKYES